MTSSGHNDDGDYDNGDNLVSAVLIIAAMLVALLLVFTLDALFDGGRGDDDADGDCQCSVADVHADVGDLLDAGLGMSW